MKRFPVLMALPPLIFAALAGLFFFGLNRDDPDALPTAHKGQPAPALTIEALADFDLLTAEDLKSGEVKLVNFWASWCTPCRAEHPILQDLADQGMTVYGINYKDNAEKAEGFLAELGNPFARQGQDPRGRTGLDWGLYGVPETFVIDEKGEVVARIAGPLIGGAYDNILLPAIREAQGN